MDNPNWFLTKKFSENIYLTTEHHFAIGNRANCWLIRVSVVFLTMSHVVSIEFCWVI